MNAHSHIASTPPLTSDDADKLYDLASCLAHSLHFLLFDLEFGFKRDRGQADGNTITLKFQRDGIDATLWLVSETWSRAANLRDAVVAIQDRFDAVEGNAS